MVAFFTSSSTSQVRQGKPLEFLGKEDYWVHETIVCGKADAQIAWGHWEATGLLGHGAYRFQGIRVTGPWLHGASGS